MKNIQRNKKGFTLIELLAIIVILAVIMAIAIPQVLNVVNGSKDSAWKDNVKMISKAIELNTQMLDPETGGYTYTVESLCKNPNNVNKISKSTDTKVKCSSNVFTINGTGQFDGKTATIDCRSGNCISSITEGSGENIPSNSPEPIPEPVSFATDTWSTIVANVKAGNTSIYAPTADGVDNQVLREVDLGDLGVHYLRVANTTPCTNGETSETACGFVIEFADTISEQKMNTTNTNIGGYPASEMFTYINNTVYNVLPTEIRNSIIDTTVVSGHGTTEGEGNFTSTDKLYLLDRQEVYGDNSSSNTAASATRQLDYYRLNNTSADRTKEYQGSTSWWWLRSASSSYTKSFGIVYYGGIASYVTVSYTYGVSPAFRIG